MADITLSDGTEITFDLRKMSYGQWKGIFDPNEKEEDSDQTLARVAGIPYERLREIPFPDYKALFQAFLKKAREPLASPNSVSVSTLP